MGAYDYVLPGKNIALKPITPRDTSKLLIFDTAKSTISFDRFFNLDKYLPADSFLVLNNTKVLPARVEMKKETGGKVVILFLVNIPSVIPSPASSGINPVEGSIVPAMADRKIEVGNKLFFEKNISVFSE